MEKYYELLYDRIETEYDQFIAELHMLPAEEIINHSYEKVFKGEIKINLISLLADCLLDPEDAENLYYCDKPLDFLY